MKNKILLFILVTCAIIKSNFLMAQDFRGTHFRNGDLIPHIESNEEWRSAGENKQPAWCYYNNDPANGPQYGKLYNWYAVSDPRGLCPVGWHVPSEDEWTELTDALGGEDGGANKMKSNIGWKDTGEEKNGNGNNSSRFSGLPGGWRYYKGGFVDVGFLGSWWSSSEGETVGARTRFLYNSSGYAFQGYGDNKSSGFSVRCLRD